MKIGKETGSIVNWMLANPKYVKPAIGMDVTEFHWSDRSAWHVIAVDEDLKGCTLQRYAPKAIGNYFEQNYQYDDENGVPMLQKGHTMHIRYKYKNWKHGSSTVNLRFNYRNEYEDPSF